MFSDTNHKIEDLDVTLEYKLHKNHESPIPPPLGINYLSKRNISYIKIGKKNEKRKRT